MRLMSTAVPIAVCLGIIAAATIGNDLAPLSTDLLVLDAEGHSATFAQEDPECKSYQTCGTNRHPGIKFEVQQSRGS